MEVAAGAGRGVAQFGDEGLGFARGFDVGIFGRQLGQLGIHLGQALGEAGEPALAVADQLA